jgi:hypothetical protein
LAPGRVGTARTVNDQYSDGQLFMKSRAGAIVKRRRRAVGDASQPTCSAVAGSGSGLSGDYFSARP